MESDRPKPYERFVDRTLFQKSEWPGAVTCFQYYMQNGPLQLAQQIQGDQLSCSRENCMATLCFLLFMFSQIFVVYKQNNVEVESISY